MSTTDIVTLGIEVDSSQVKGAADELSKLGESASGAEGPVKQLGSSANEAGHGVHEMSLSVKELIEALGVIELIKEAVDVLKELTIGAYESAHNLAELSERTGATISQLSSMRDAATLAGRDFETMSKSLDRINKTASEAADPASKAGLAYAALGINVMNADGSMKNSGDLMQEIAVAQEQFANGANKTAILMQIGGKAMAANIPVLNQMAEATGQSNTITQEAADSAQALTAAVGGLKIQAEQNASTFMTSLTPALLQIIKAYKDWSTNNQELIADVGTFVGGALKALALGVMIAVTAIKNVITDLQTFGELLTTPFGQGWKDTVLSILAARNASIEANNQALAKFYANLNSPPSIPHPENNADKPDAPNVTTSAAGIKAANTALQEYNAYMAQAQAAEEKMTDALNIHFDAAMQKILAAQAAGHAWSIEQQANALAEGHDWDQRDLAAKQALELYKQQEEAVKRNQAIVDASNKQYDQFNQKMAQGVVQAQHQIDILGKTPEEIAKSNAELKVQLETQAELNKIFADYQTAEQNGATDATLLLIKQHWDDIKNGEQGAVDTAGQLATAYSQAQQAASTIKQEMDSLNQIGQTFFEDLFTQGDKAFKNLGQSLEKNLIDLLYKMITQQWVINISASVTQSAVSGAAGAAGSAAGGAGGIGSIFSGIGSAASFITSGIAALPTSAAALAANLDLVGEAGLSAVGGLTGLASSVWAVLGPIGAIAGVAYLAYTLFSQAKGGPKSGGFASSGDVSELPLDSDNHRYYTPTTADSDLSPIATGLQSAYGTSLAALGGTGTAGFAVGYDTDPQGTADSRLSVGATVNGKQVYSVRNADEGKGTTQLQADLSTDAQRALLAALQASSLPTDIAKIIDSVDASTASADDVQRVIAYGTALKTVDDLMAKNPIADAMTAIKTSSEDAQQQLSDQSTTLQAMGKAFDGSTAASTALSNATQTYYNNVVKVIAAMEQMKGTISSMFKGSEQSWTQSTQTSSQRYTYDQAQIAKLSSDMNTTTSASQVQSDANQINTLMNDAWSQLSPAQQQAQLQAFIKTADTINQEAQDRISKLETDTATQANDTIAAIQKAMQDPANTQSDAATKQTTAASTQSGAADQMTVAANQMTTAANAITAAVNKFGSEINA